MRKLLLTFAALALAMPCLAVSPQELQEALDSMSVLIYERTGVEGQLVLRSVARRGSTLDLTFDYSLSDYPWREGDPEWFRSTFKSLLPAQYQGCTIGTVKSRGTRLEELPTPALGFSGAPSRYKFRYPDRNLKEQFVSREGESFYPGGLSGRNIALWQSHGRYYDSGDGSWSWQRAPVNRTVEDIYTQSYVLPFLIPMLENAGAYVMTPRERDPQKYEVVIDNDPAFEGERPLPLRQKGVYSEKGLWKTGGTGFADTKPVYMLDENPFKDGSTRYASCSPKPTAGALWSFEVPERGFYAVYVSYESRPESSPAARYSIYHLGGETVITVDQRKGGGTWIYLGTFEFKGEGAVSLDNSLSSALGGSSKCVSADGVRIGGGMGKIARGEQDDDPADYELSGFPAYLEGALYSMQWAGIDTSVTRQWEGEYTRDFASRGAWVANMSGGSVSAPKSKGRGIPIDMSLAFHSDAGVTPNDSTIGTLAIYTLFSEKKSTLPDGKNRVIGRHYADLVQSQVVRDIRAEFDTSWRRRCIWNRSFSESRTTEVPGMLLELLSHQNFADMRYGLDPSFRFTASRAVYKGMLKFLSDMHGIPYTVQPLPVNSFSAAFSGPGKAVLSWKATVDTLEPTAVSKRFFLYTRIDDGAFDEGRLLSGISETAGMYRATVEITPGHVWSFRIAAENDGGRSFPSETLSIGYPASGSKGTVLIVNNFDRVSPPAWFDTPSYAGFDSRLDSGVPWIRDISYGGEDYEHRRSVTFESDDDPGFGASRLDMAGTIVAGNTFDYPAVHGRELLSLGYSFISCSRDGLVALPSLSSGTFALDLVCGKQVTTRIGSGSYPDRFQVFPTELRELLTLYASNGGNLIVSGSYIGRDSWSGVFPVSRSEEEREEEKRFIRSTLGYVYSGGFASNDGSVVPKRNRTISSVSSATPLSFRTSPNPECYSVENPDALSGADKKKSTVFLNYGDTGRGAAVCFDGGDHRAVSFGFPLETLKSPDQIRALLECSLEYFRK